MNIFSLSFLFGICSIFYFAAIPNLYIILIYVFSTIILHIFLRNRFSLILLALCLGFSWAMFFSHLQLEKQLPKKLEGKNLLVKGEIISLPKQGNKKTDFLFKIYNVEPSFSKDIKLPIKVKLNWYSFYGQLKPGDKFQLQIRLKRPHGFRNQGSMDYEKILFRKGIGATGYVVSSPYNQLISSNWYNQSIARFRYLLKNKIDQKLSQEPFKPFLLALLIGDRQGINQEQWKVLRRTGTNHIIAIAGLHIGLIAGFVFFAVNFVWKRISFLTLRIPSKNAAAFFSLIIAFLYSALAGFSLPTIRALIMSSVFLGSVLFKRMIVSIHSLCFALLLVLIIDPLSVLDTGFWLSFTCVGIIIYGMQGRLGKENFLSKYLRFQWVIIIGLFPLILWSFSEMSFVSPIANMIVVPWFGFVILPLSFLGAIFIFLNPQIGYAIFWLALKNLHCVWFLLENLAYVPFIVCKHNIPNISILISLFVASIFILSPRGFPFRSLSLLFLLPLLMFQENLPENEEVWFTLFDVGQGLASIVQTRNHTLIFDAGPYSSEEFNAGTLVILPYLSSINIKKIDELIITHGDNDHIGGAKPILKEISADEILSSVPRRFKKAYYCHQGMHWIWDGIKFDILSPKVGNYKQGNNSSCVLKITTKDQSILLTGDIEKQTEKLLTQNEPNHLKSTILVAPHHGSKTSSSSQFVKSVNPKIVLFPIGYRNRFRFPHKSIIRRYSKIGAMQYDTAHSGAISIKLNGNKIEPILYREQKRHIWND